MQVSPEPFIFGDRVAAAKSIFLFIEKNGEIFSRNINALGPLDPPDGQKAGKIRSFSTGDALTERMRGSE